MYLCIYFWSKVLQNLIKKMLFSLRCHLGTVLWLGKHNRFLPFPPLSFLRRAVWRYTFSVSPASPVFIFARAKQRKVPPATESHGRKRKRLPQNQDEDDDVDAWEEKKNCKFAWCLHAHLCRSIKTGSVIMVPCACLNASIFANKQTWSKINAQTCFFLLLPPPPVRGNSRLFHLKSK